MRTLFMLSLLMWLNGCTPALRPSPPASTTSPSVPVVAVPYAEVAPAVDASPDDPAWQAAVVIDGLTPSIGTKPGTRSLPTQIALLWDERFLYVRFTCRDDEIYTPFQGDQRDRDYYQGDVAELFLDAVGDGRQYYEVQVTPLNQVLDQTLLVTGQTIAFSRTGRLTKEILARDWWRCLSLNIEGLRTAASRSADGKTWIVDIAFPAKAALRRLGRETFSPMALRAHLMRYDWQLIDGQRVLHPLNWSPVEFGRPHQSPAAMGRLELTARPGLDHSGQSEQRSPPPPRPAPR